MLHHEDAGQGPLIVLLHGVTENSTAWEPVVGPLATTHRVLALDLRGHGRSPAQPPYDMLTLAQDVRITLDALAPQQPPLIIGHSLGAMVATVYAAMHPVRAVVNVDQSLDLAHMQQTVLDLLPRLRTAQFTDALDAMFTQLEAGALSPAESARLKSLRRYERDVVLGIWGGDLQQAPPTELVNLAAGLLSAIRVPYLALHGSEPGPEYRTWLATTQPAVTVEVWPGCGHYPHLVHPERFVDRVRRMRLDTGPQQAPQEEAAGESP
ncbi:alpha/beta fold hydrolase [Streptomyces sp. GESEQ-35]|uniref:alpha/beta fold hydrolase n=1 Tax=Streptomyces sp. GESEQ-35 TaxID=2812657 RepID=UPI001B3274B7|nr:alpha/beta hydrolase [Streptomyces sp. GESEQ-35]